MFAQIIIGKYKTDEEFAKKLYKAVDLKKLMPSVADSHLLSIWDSLFKAALTQSYEFLGRGAKNYLLVNENNKPCGALAIFKYINSNLDNYKLRYLCTWPTSVEHREPLAGKALMLNLFKKVFENNQAPGKIELEAINHSLFSPVAKYLNVGFSITGGDNFITNMRINKEKLPKILQKFAHILNIESVEEPQHLDLSRSLDISY